MTPRQEWQACRDGACVIPLKTRRLLQVSGPDRGPFLQGLFSRDTVKNFPAGKTIYGVFPNLKGKIVADAWVQHADSNRFLLDAESSAQERLLKHLETYRTLWDTAVKPLPDYSRISVLGPQKEKIFDACKTSGASLSAFPVQRERFSELAVWIPSGDESRLRNCLEKHGAVLGSERVYDTIQIECGIPRMGREMDETVFPQEAGLHEALDFQKGCFLGAETLQRIRYQGHVNRALALFAAPVPLPRGADIFLENAPAGKITTCTESFQYNKLVALGLVRTAALEKPLAAVLDGRKVPLTLLRAFDKPN